MSRTQRFPAAAALLLAGCNPGPTDLRAADQRAVTQANPQTETEAGLGRESRFGVDYVFPLETKYRTEAWANTMASTGAGWLNMADVCWQRIERNEPGAKGHRYHWDDLDEAVSLYQDAGFHLVFGLRMGAGWFAGPKRHESNLDSVLSALYIRNSDRLPADEYRDDYRAWIRALVERYDGDGDADMPGLRTPVRHYQVGNEYANAMFWTGTVDDYATLLRETARAAREASPDAVVISNGIRWNDMFHGDPEGALFEKRFATFIDALPSGGLRQEWTRARRLTEKTVALAPEYDILDAGGNGPYPTASEGYMAWVRAELAKAGAQPTIWDMEARSEPALLHAPHTAFHPELQVPGGQEILQLLKRPRHADHARAVAWYRAEQARILAKVFTTRFGAGFEKVFLGMPDDWDASIAVLATPNPFIGLCDSGGEPWPALAVFAMFVEKLDGFVTAEKVPGQPGVALYRFDFASGRAPVWVVWLKEDAVRGLADELPMRSVQLPRITSPAVATPIQTDGEPPSELRFAPNSTVQLALTPTPVIISEL